MKPVGTATVAGETWGGSCTAWRLVTGPDLAVAEETMPPGTSEARHHHQRARQFFYVLEGTLAMEMSGETLRLRAGQGLEIAPGTPHRAHNPGPQTTRFLVVSAPTSKGDRVETS